MFKCIPYQPSANAFQPDTIRQLLHPPLFSNRIWNSNSLGSLKNRPSRERPPVPDQTFRTINSIFCQHPTTFLRRADSDIGTPYFTVQNILKSLIHRFPYKITMCIGYNHTIFLNELLFFNCVRTACCRTPVSYHRSSFLMNVSFMSPN